MQHRFRIAVQAGTLVLLAGSAGAADFGDPTWPCIQRKVPELSVGLMWPGPTDPAAIPPEAAADADSLAARLALRRLPEAELPPLVAAFTEAHGADEALLGAVFDKAFRPLSRTRSAIVAGIERYAAKQNALAERIDGARTEMDTLMAAAEPDFDRVDALEEQIDWDERIFDDRRRSLTYVCETPVLIEKRLYAVAQLLQSAVR